MKRLSFLLIGAFAMLSGIIPSGAFGQAPLDTYIQEGLKSNLALQQRNVSLEQAMYSLKIAGSYFLPTVSFNSGYTSGNGGRAISLPVGDLLNPVYSTLNQLTDSKNFPAIENAEQSFFPRNFIDGHIRTALPLINADLHYNKRIQEDQVQLKELEVKILKRELIKNIKTAYYNYLGAQEAVNIYTGALALVQRNLAVNESLLKNGKGLPATVLRAESELENVRAQLSDAENNLQNARRYFNFLLNKPQESPIEAPADPKALLTDVPLAISLPMSGFERREELQMAQTGIRINENISQLNQYYWVPKVNGFVDLGIQAENWDWSSDSRYYLMGVSLDVPLFSGFRNSYKVRQAGLGIKEAQLKRDENFRQLELSAGVAQNNLATAWQNYLASEKRLKASAAYFSLIEKGYAQGSSSLIEFIDARNQLTTAQLQQTIQTYRVLSAMAQYERETTAFPINH